MKKDIKNIQVSKEVHQAIRMIAAREGWTISRVVHIALKDWAHRQNFDLKKRDKPIDELMHVLSDAAMKELEK